MEPNDQNGLQFNVQFDESSNEETIPFQVVVFDRSKSVIYQSQVKEENFSLPFTADELKDNRVFLAPYNQERKADLTIETLEKGSGFEVTIPSLIDPGKPIQLNPIPKYIWCWWMFCFCYVRGRVFNYCENEYLPVYKARVHICEVDTIIWYIQKLPDYEIFKLRDDLLAKIIDWHLPDPPPEVTKNIRINPAKTLNTIQKETAISARSLQFNNEPATTFDKTASLLILPQENLAAFHSDSAYLIRNYLVANYKILYPFWCWLNPWFLRCDEVAVVETDNNGWFNTTLWYACCDDKPDLYFWVEYFINGAWVTVYNPGLRCGTYWDYACNTEVDIYLDNANIPCSARPPLIGKKVSVLTIGNNINVSQINSSPGDPNFGLIQRQMGFDFAGDVWAPFGGSLEPRVDFGDVLANAGYLYKWSYSIHGANNWKPLTDSVVRHYRHETLFTLSYPAYPLGPVSGEYFHICPVLTPDGNSHWVIADSRADTASAYFNTNGLGILAGIYDMKLELYHSDLSPVNFTTDGIDLFVADPTQDAPFGNQTVNTINAPSNNILWSGTPGSSDVLGFIMTVRIDNNVTTALINETVDNTNGNSAGDCGMIQMNAASLDGLNHDQIDISYIAKHPNNFAVFDFTIYKGSSGAEHRANGQVSNSPAITVTDAYGGIPEPYTYTPGSSKFETIKPAYKLLDGCLEAAFSEVLNVYATATDGYQNLTGYDRSDVKAFALKH